jgi:hypothetical protein
MSGQRSEVVLAQAILGLLDGMGRHLLPWGIKKLSQAQA